MADQLLPISGVLVACESRSYDGFTTADGEAVAGGVKRILHVSVGFGDAPQAVNVGPKNAHLFEAAQRAGFGAAVIIECVGFAKTGPGGRAFIERVASAIEVEPALASA